MRPVYKTVKVQKEHCPQCKEQLRGNNSFAFPWHCSCGVWEMESKYPLTFEYQIKCLPLAS